MSVRLSPPKRTQSTFLSSSSPQQQTNTNAGLNSATPKQTAPVPSRMGRDKTNKAHANVVGSPLTRLFHNRHQREQEQSTTAAVNNGDDVQKIPSTSTASPPSPPGAEGISSPLSSYDPLGSRHLLPLARAFALRHCQQQHQQPRSSQMAPASFASMFVSPDFIIGAITEHCEKRNFLNKSRGVLDDLFPAWRLGSVGVVSSSSSSASSLPVSHLRLVIGPQMNAPDADSAAQRQIVSSVVASLQHQLRDARSRVRSRLKEEREKKKGINVKQQKIDAYRRNRHQSPHSSSSSRADAEEAATADNKPRKSRFSVKYDAPHVAASVRTATSSSAQPFSSEDHSSAMTTTTQTSVHAVAGITTTTHIRQTIPIVAGIASEAIGTTLEHALAISTLQDGLSLLAMLSHRGQLGAYTVKIEKEKRITATRTRTRAHDDGAAAAQNEQNHSSSLAALYLGGDGGVSHSGDSDDDACNRASTTRDEGAKSTHIDERDVHLRCNIAVAATRQPFWYRDWWNTPIAALIIAAVGEQWAARQRKEKAERREATRTMRATAHKATYVHDNNTAATMCVEGDDDIINMIGIHASTYLASIMVAERAKGAAAASVNQREGEGRSSSSSPLRSVRFELLAHQTNAHSSQENDQKPLPSVSLEWRAVRQALSKILLSPSSNGGNNKTSASGVANFVRLICAIVIANEVRLVHRDDLDAWLPSEASVGEELSASSPLPTSTSSPLRKRGASSPVSREGQSCFSPLSSPRRFATTTASPSREKGGASGRVAAAPPTPMTAARSAPTPSSIPILQPATVADWEGFRALTTLLMRARGEEEGGAANNVDNAMAALLRVLRTAPSPSCVPSSASPIETVTCDTELARQIFRRNIDREQRSDADMSAPQLSTPNNDGANSTPIPVRRICMLPTELGHWATALVEEGLARRLAARHVFPVGGGSVVGGVGFVDANGGASLLADTDDDDGDGDSDDGNGDVNHSLRECETNTTPTTATNVCCIRERTEKETILINAAACLLESEEEEHDGEGAHNGDVSSVSSPSSRRSLPQTSLEDIASFFARNRLLSGSVYNHHRTTPRNASGIPLTSSALPSSLTPLSTAVVALSDPSPSHSTAAGVGRRGALTHSHIAQLDPRALLTNLCYDHSIALGAVGYASPLSPLSLSMDGSSASAAMPFPAMEAVRRRSLKVIAHFTSGVFSATAAPPPLSTDAACSSIQSLSSSHHHSPHRHPAVISACTRLGLLQVDKAIEDRVYQCERDEGEEGREGVHRRRRGGGSDGVPVERMVVYCCPDDSNDGTSVTDVAPSSSTPFLQVFHSFTGRTPIVYGGGRIPSSASAGGLLLWPMDLSGDQLASLEVSQPSRSEAKPTASTTHLKEVYAGGRGGGRGGHRSFSARRHVDSTTGSANIGAKPAAAKAAKAGGVMTASAFKEIQQREVVDVAFSNFLGEMSRQFVASIDAVYAPLLSVLGGGGGGGMRDAKGIAASSSSSSFHAEAVAKCFLHIVPALSPEVFANNNQSGLEKGSVFSSDVFLASPFYRGLSASLAARVLGRADASSVAAKGNTQEQRALDQTASVSSPSDAEVKAQPPSSHPRSASASSTASSAYDDLLPIPFPLFCALFFPICAAVNPPFLAHMQQRERSGNGMADATVVKLLCEGLGLPQHAFRIVTAKDSKIYSNGSSPLDSIPFLGGSGRVDFPTGTNTNSNIERTDKSSRRLPSTITNGEVLLSPAAVDQLEAMRRGHCHHQNEGGAAALKSLREEVLAHRKVSREARERPWRGGGGVTASSTTAGRKGRSNSRSPSISSSRASSLDSGVGNGNGADHPHVNPPLTRPLSPSTSQLVNLASGEHKQSHRRRSRSNSRESSLSTTLPSSHASLSLSDIVAASDVDERSNTKRKKECDDHPTAVASAEKPHETMNGPPPSTAAEGQQTRSTRLVFSRGFEDDSATASTASSLASIIAAVSSVEGKTDEGGKGGEEGDGKRSIKSLFVDPIPTIAAAIVGKPPKSPVRTLHTTAAQNANAKSDKPSSTAEALPSSSDGSASDLGEATAKALARTNSDTATPANVAPTTPATDANTASNASAAIVDDANVRMALIRKHFDKRFDFTFAKAIDHRDALSSSSGSNIVKKAATTATTLKMGDNPQQGDDVATSGGDTRADGGAADFEDVFVEIDVDNDALLTSNNETAASAGAEVAEKVVRNLPLDSSRASTSAQSSSDAAIVDGESTTNHLSTAQRRNKRRSGTEAAPEGSGSRNDSSRSSLSRDSSTTQLQVPPPWRKKVDLEQIVRLNSATRNKIALQKEKEKGEEEARRNHSSLRRQSASSSRSTSTVRSSEGSDARGCRRHSIDDTSFVASSLASSITSSSSAPSAAVDATASQRHSGALPCSSVNGHEEPHQPDQRSDPNQLHQLSRREMVRAVSNTMSSSPLPSPSSPAAGGEEKRMRDMFWSSLPTTTTTGGVAAGGASKKGACDCLVPSHFRNRHEGINSTRGANHHHYHHHPHDPVANMSASPLRRQGSAVGHHNITPMRRATHEVTGGGGDGVGGSGSGLLTVADFHLLVDRTLGHVESSMIADRGKRDGSQKPITYKL